MILKTKIVRFIRRAARFLFCAFLVMSLLAGALLFSHSGNQILINMVKKAEPRFSIELERGTLFNSPVYSQISWIDQQTNIQIGSASYLFDWSCLFNKVCFKALNISNASIIITHFPSADAGKESDKIDLSAFKLPVAFDLQAMQLTNMHFALGELTVDLNELHLQAQGIGKEIRLKTVIDGLQLNLPESAPVSPTNKKQRTSLPALLSAENLPVISLPLNLYVDPLEIHHFTLKQSGKSIFELNSLHSQFSFIGSRLALQSFSLDLPETDLQLKGDINFIAHYPLNLHLTGQLKSIKQLQQAQLFKGQLYDLKSSGDLSQLKSELFLSNKVTLQLSSEVNLLKANLPYTLSLAWQKLQWPLAGESQYRSENGTLHSSGDLSHYLIKLAADYHLENIPGDLILQAQGDLQQLNIEQLKMNTLDGSLNLQGLLGWQDAIKWRGLLSVDKIDLAQLNTQYTGNFSGTIQHHFTVPLDAPASPAWAFSLPVLDLHGQFLKRPFSVSGGLSGNDKQGISVQHVVITNGENKLTFNGAVAQKNDLKVKLDIADLGHLVLGGAGKVKGEIQLQGPNDALQIKSNLQGELLSYQANRVDSFKLSSLAIASKIPKVTLQLEADKLSLADNKIDKIRLQIENIRSAKAAEHHQMDLSVSSHLVASTLQIQIFQNSQNWLSKLTAANLSFAQQQLRLKSPINLLIENETLLLSPHCWQSASENNENGGTLCFEKLAIGREGEVVLDLDSYLLSSLDPLLPDELKIAGALSGDAQIKWFATKKPEFNVNLLSEGMSVRVHLKQPKKRDKVYPINRFNITLASNKEATSLLLDLHSPKLIAAKIQGQLFLDHDSADINASADIELPDFSPFAVLLPELEKLTGQLQARLTMSGPLKHPFVDGLITINNSEIIALGAPVHISQLNTAITLNNRTATVEGTFYTDPYSALEEQGIHAQTLMGNAMTLFDSSITMVGKTIKKGKEIITLNKTKDKEAGGLATIKGTFDWEEKITGDIHFFADKMTLNDYGYIDFLISPDLHLTFAEGVKIQGNIFIDKGKITVKELPEGAVSNSKDVIVVDIESPKRAATMPVEIDLQVELGDRLKIKALGLDSTINGHLLIRKRVDRNIAVHGELKFVDGSYRALGQQLVLQKSRINFQGVADSPYISIEAIRDPNKIADNVTAGVRVTGTPDELALVIFSDPVMAQQDALAYLTRGKSLQASSTAQDNGQIASMLIDLGADKSSDVMSDIGKMVGISDLSLSSAGSGVSQSVGVSGEIAPGIELSYGVGVFDNFRIFAIRYEIFERFYIEASSSLDQAIDAYYEFDWE